MKLVRTVFEIELDEQKFELRKPKFKETQQYRESLLKIGESGDSATVMTVMQEFLELLGLPVGVFETLEFDHITQLMETVAGSKKN